MNSESETSQLGNSLAKIFFRIFSVEKPKFDTVKLKSNNRIYVKKTIHMKPDPQDYWKFQTDGVFKNCKQEEIYNDVVGDLLDKLELGQNAIIISFGKTGTGKSTTIAGLEYSREDYGIGPRIIKNLLEIKKSLEQNKRMCIKMSYAEFAYGSVFDLFKTYPNRVENLWKLLNKLVKVKVHTELQALEELYAGEGRKDTKRVKHYTSHLYSSILTFYVTIKDMDYSYPRQITSKIHLVDMAGADTAGSLSSFFKSSKQVGLANLNKTYMEQFFLALCQRDRPMISVKKRNNPLLEFLGKDIWRQSALRFIGHITTSKEDCTLTTSMLKFGQIVRGFTPEVVNLAHEVCPEYKLKYLQNKLEMMEKERIQNSVLFNQNLNQDMNCERMEYLNKLIKNYLKNQISEIQIMTVADASTIFKLFKDMLDQVETEKSNLKDNLRNAISTETFQQKKKFSKDRSFTSTKHRNVIDKQISVQTIPFDDIKIRLNKKEPELSINEDMARSSKKSKTRMSETQRRQSVNKRRSILSNMDSEMMTERSFLPANIPENMEAWHEYSKNSQYNTFAEQYNENENNILESYTEYLREFEQFNKFKNQIEAMKHELLEAKVLMKFKENSVDMDQYTETILNEAEFLCNDKLEKAKKAMLTEQEALLRCLSELKIFLNIRKDLRRKLNEDFEHFCKTKFNMPIPQLDSFSELVTESKQITKEEECQREAEEKIQTEQEQKEIQAHLLDIMVQEKKKLQKSKHFSKPFVLIPLQCCNRDACY